MSLTMMNRFLLVVVVFMPAVTFVATMAAPNPEKFDDFEKKFNKKYKNKEERDHRFVLL